LDPIVAGCPSCEANCSEATYSRLCLHQLQSPTSKTHATYNTSKIVRASRVPAEKKKKAAKAKSKSKKGTNGEK